MRDFNPFSFIIFSITKTIGVIGLLSDSGTPCIADPGNKIVAYAHKKGISVKPLVGPSSIILSLMSSGFNGQNFIFRGYLPKKSGERFDLLREMERDIIKSGITQIFIETPYLGEAPQDKKYNDEDTKLSTLSVSQDNFLGTGNRLATSISTGDINKVYSLSFTDPYWTEDG